MNVNFYKRCSSAMLQREIGQVASFLLIAAGIAAGEQEGFRLIFHAF